MAFISSLMTNLTISVHGKKGAKMTNPMDFMPEWDISSGKGEVKKQSVDDMKKFLLGIAQAQNKKVAMKNRKSKPPNESNKIKK